MAADAFYKIESLISFERNTNDSGNIAAKGEKGRITLMLLLRENMMINIFITVAFVFVLFLIIYKYGKRINSVNPKKET